MQRGRFSRLGVGTAILGTALLLGWLGSAVRSTAAAPQAPKGSGKRTGIGVPVPRLPPGPAPAFSSFIPSDAKPTCVVTAPVFASWFQSGTVTLNGVVNPANSVTFPNSGNCSFYQWSEQMFLWLTSPSPSRYGGDSPIFNSQVFYDVSPPGPDGKRTFIPHKAGQILPFAVRSAQLGPHRLPIVLDKAGRVFEVETPPLAPSGKQLLRNKAGQQVEIQSVTIGKDRKAIFRDKAGNAIELPPAPPLARRPNEPLIARRFAVNNQFVLLDAAGNVIDTEQGQAGGGQVLQAQNKSLVYFATMVNDVYAYFLTGAKNGGITPTPTQFPTTQAELNKVITFAQAHGKTFPDPEALAFEVKTAWVEAASLPNPGSYITIKATIPTYNTSNPNQWVPNGQKTTQLALVAMHVVGSAAGHPEMIWATFEHFGITPDAAFTYITTSNTPKTVSQSTAGTWLFTATNSTGPFNVAHMKVSGANIVPIPPNTISPSDTLRTKAWGAATDVKPNPLVADTAASNTEVIAINNSVLGQLKPGDIRTNYYMTGSTWTIGGAAPTGSFKPGSPPTGNEVGTSKLANTTMETYQQGSSLWAAGTNCFTCHTTNQTAVSHVYNPLIPLFP